MKQGDQIQSSGLQLIGWNPQIQRIQSWVFTSDGGQAVGQWSPRGNGWVIETTGMLSDGTPTQAVNIFTRLDDNALSWKSCRMFSGRCAAGKCRRSTFEKRVAPSADRAFETIHNQFIVENSLMTIRFFMRWEQSCYWAVCSRVMFSHAASVVFMAADLVVDSAAVDSAGADSAAAAWEVAVSGVMVLAAGDSGAVACAGGDRFGSGGFGGADRGGFGGGNLGGGFGAGGQRLGRWLGRRGELRRRSSRRSRIGARRW